jgi:hypothetical protein
MHVTSIKHDHYSVYSTVSHCLTQRSTHQCLVLSLSVNTIILITSMHVSIITKTCTSPEFMHLRTLMLASMQCNTTRHSNTHARTQAHQTDTSPDNCSTTRNVRPAQTVPGQARDIWAQACTRHIDVVLQAVDHGQGTGLPAAAASLMSLPTRVLADSQASRRRALSIVARLERIKLDEPIRDDNSNDGPAPTAHRPTRGPAAHLKAAAIRRHIANGNITNAANTIDAPPLLSPQTRSSLTSRDSTPRPTYQYPRSARWPQLKFLQPICEVYSAHFPEARLAVCRGGHRSTYRQRQTTGYPPLRLS